jgi:SAM-dependent methyltransferase
MGSGLKVRHLGWEKRFFREPVFTPGDAHTEAAAPAEASFLWRALKLRKGSRVLDICCGTGRHAVRLARRGAVVTGVDATAAYLLRVPRIAGLRSLKADMRRLPFDGEFDAAYNVWTSFGYFASVSEDLKALKAAARALKPGGLFLVDLLDWEWLKGNFKPQQWARRPDGAYRLEESSLRFGSDPRLECSWTIVGGRRPEKVDFFIRGYDEKRLSALLRRAGLKPIGRWNSLDGRKVGPRLVLLARKGL